jgi:uncharacterized protein (DUF39 family)
MVCAFKGSFMLGMYLRYYGNAILFQVNLIVSVLQRPAVPRKLKKNTQIFADISILDIQLYFILITHVYFTQQLSTR